MTDSNDAHNHWMALALEQAELAAAAGEVPVGAVVVCAGQVIAKAYNQTLQLADPTAHAEVLALRMAAQVLGNHRLNECMLYVTLEPCAMCSGAVFQARLKAVVYGAQEPKTGAAGSVVDLFANVQLNHHTAIVGGVMAGPASALLARFFAQRRAAAASKHAPQRLSDAALRTPARAFDGQAPEGAYTDSLPSAQGLRMHYLQHGATPGPDHTVWVLLHPLWHWSAWWQPLLRALGAQGDSAIAPDLIGWGRSDKPKRADWHSEARHAQLVLELLQSWGVRRCVLVGQDGSEALAQALLARSAARLDVAAVLQLHCVDSKGIWPAPPKQAMQKTWRVDAYLRAHLLSDGPVWQQAAAPYPDAGHARNWASGCFAAPVPVLEAANLYQLDAHAQRDAIKLAQQLRIMAQAWSAAHRPPQV